MAGEVSSLIEFEAWPKTTRLSRETMVITEKIDGTNAAVGIKGPFQFGEHADGMPEHAALAFGPAGEDGMPDQEFLVYAQSRKRLITPDSDNFGFARWVWDNAEGLARVLGTGLHFGEWWGSGIQRGYGLPQGEKRFSLFNTHRWGWLNDLPEHAQGEAPEGLGVVPVLHTGPLRTNAVWVYLSALEGQSVAAPGFTNPEGICIYMVDAGKTYKMTYDGDMPKSAAIANPTRIRLDYIELEGELAA